jgi:hypothetical protein
VWLVWTSAGLVRFSPMGRGLVDRLCMDLTLGTQ